MSAEPDADHGEQEAVAALLCSAKGCRRPAAWALRWNNPKLHPPERRKTWLACVEHRQRLADFLEARRFLRETEPIDDSGAAQEP
jgi:hypothetical protein